MTRVVNQLSWKIGGEAGFGIMASGSIFAKTCLRAGLQVADYSEYPSLIRGGHNTYQVTASVKPTWAHQSAVNILVALNLATVTTHLPEVSQHGAIIYDTDDPSFKNFSPRTVSRSDIRWLGLPLGTLARTQGGEVLMRNTVAVGATFALLSVDFSFPADVVREIFSGKKQEVIDQNIAALQAGFDAITAEHPQAFPWDLEPLRGAPARVFLTGNEAVGMGALQAGCQFYAAYPMTPATTILAFLANHGPKHGMLVRHAEDEIGVINETIGAAYAGVRAMCGTAGGGFSLMTEAVGLAGMTEVGAVIVEAQRGGPSTGLPTWTEQADLRQVLHASQGDFLKIVFAPGDVEECFRFTQLAFNIADQFQTPVIVMTDKYLGESHRSVDRDSLVVLPIDRGAIVSPKKLPTDDSYRRYADTPSGVSPRSLPGMEHGLFVSNSDEHDPEGMTSEEISHRLEQMDKRGRKEHTVRQHLPAPKLFGPAKADVTIVSWGSTKGPVRQAMAILQEQHHVSVNHLHLPVLNPFPAEAVENILRHAHLSIIVEGNQSGQLEGWIRQQTGRTFDHHVRRYDGRPFDPEQLASHFLQLVK